MFSQIFTGLALLAGAAEAGLTLGRRHEGFGALLDITKRNANRATENARREILNAAQSQGMHYKSFMPFDDDEFDVGQVDAADDASDYSAHQFVVAKEQDDEIKAENDNEDDANQAQIDADDESTNFGEDFE